MTVASGAAGRRTVFVRFGGLDWDVRTRIEAFSRAGASGA
jgi:hypothetical protein